MPFKFQIDGRTVECDSARDAAELLRLLGPAAGSSGTERGAARPRQRASATEQVISVLEEIRKAGPQGILSPDLAQRLGLRGTRGLGSMIGAVKRELKAVGQPFEDVVALERSRNGTRWFSTRNTLGAIEALRASIAPAWLDALSNDDDGAAPVRRGATEEIVLPPPPVLKTP